MAMRVAALQQELMVAALTCHAAQPYNAFVISYQDELQASDSELKAHFTSARAGGIADYHAFKTRLANQDSIRSIRDSNYCYEADAAFRTAEYSRSLANAAARTPVMIDAASLDCVPSFDQAYNIPPSQDRMTVEGSGRDGYGEAPRHHVFAPDARQN
jgi:hypothetical protein